MTFDTFESLKVGDRLKPVLKKRSYPVVRIGFFRGEPNGVRTVYVCLNPTAVERKLEPAREFGIYPARSLEHSTHYLNWDKVQA